MSKKLDELRPSPPLYYKIGSFENIDKLLATYPFGRSERIASNFFVLLVVESIRDVDALFQSVEAFRDKLVELCWSSHGRLRHRASPDARTEESEVVHDLKKHEFALEEINILLDKRPNHVLVSLDSLEQHSAIPEYTTALGFIYLVANMEDRAFALYESNGMRPYDYYNLGTFYLILKRDFQKAGEQFEKAGDLNIAIYNKGITYLIEENFDRAASCFELLAETPWQSLEANKWYSEILGSTKVTDRVRASTSAALAQSSCNNLGICYYRRHKYIRAMEWFVGASAWETFTKLPDGKLNEQFLLYMEDPEPSKVKSIRAEEKRSEFHGIIGKSEVMQEIYKSIKKLADTEHSVLITGKTGTGKELVARAIHDVSKRKDKPFIPYNCSRLTDTLGESELFGHVKGAFTGADRDYKGLFEQADGGTLFLDEIGNMGMESQARLLRVVEDKKVRRLGSKRTISVDVRIIFVTNEDLAEAIGKGEFRNDLYSRILLPRIVVPPLSERREDLPLLIDHFIEKHSSSSSEREETQSEERIKLLPDARRLLSNYEWPYNVRQLEKAIENAILMSEDGVIRPCHLSEEIQNQLRDNGDVEEQMIIEALKRNEGHVTKTAEKLNLTRQALYRRMEKYKINHKDFKLTR